MFISEKFEKFIEAFSRSHQLFVDGSRVLVATSAGVDSVVLLNVLSRMPQIKVSVLHFNHGTRPENSLEENLIINIAKNLGLELFIHRFKFSPNQSNFELKARNARKNVYKEYIQNGFLVATAHHLDDSFEWAMMQKFKQSSLKTSLGIPVFSNGIIRPLMCVSKKQIIHYAKVNQIVWCEDQSNLNTRYERNYMRLKIIEQIKIKYPQYLKHYVYQHNQLAEELQVHRLSVLKRSSPLKIVNHFLTGVVVQSSHLEFYRPEILKIVQNMSKKQRGKLSIVIDQIFDCVKKIRSNSKLKKLHGPFYFTGGVKCFLLVDRLYFFQQDNFYLWENFDRELYNSLYIGAQISSGSVNNYNLEYFPNLLTSNSARVLKKESKLKIDLIAQTLDQLKMTDIPYSFGALEETL